MQNNLNNSMKRFVLLCDEILKSIKYSGWWLQFFFFFCFIEIYIKTRTEIILITLSFQLTSLHNEIKIIDNTRSLWTASAFDRNMISLELGFSIYFFFVSIFFLWFYFCIVFTLISITYEKDIGLLSFCLVVSFNFYFINKKCWVDPI